MEWEGLEEEKEGRAEEEKALSATIAISLDTLLGIVPNPGGQKEKEREEKGDPQLDPKGLGTRTTDEVVSKEIATTAESGAIPPETAGSPKGPRGSGNLPKGKRKDLQRRPRNRKPRRKGTSEPWKGA